MLIYNLCLKVIYKKIKNWVQTQMIFLGPPPLFRPGLKFYAFFVVEPFPKYYHIFTLQGSPISTDPPLGIIDG